MNVLKPDLQTTIKTLLGKGMSQREIHRKTEIDRKSIRRYARSYHLVASEETVHSKSPTQQGVATGSGEASVQNLPPVNKRKCPVLSLGIEIDLLRRRGRNMARGKRHYLITKGRKMNMSSARARRVEVIREQPEDATYEEIMRELAFERMVAKGLEESRAGRVISNEDMRRRIRAWQR